MQDYFKNTDLANFHDRLNNRRGVFGYTPLHEAVSGNKPHVIKYLRDKGADVNAKANSGYTPLHLAASAGHIDCVTALLNCGADISETDDYGKTPKQTAGLSSKSSIVKLLRSEGTCLLMVCLMYLIYRKVKCFKKGVMYTILVHTYFHMYKFFVVLK